MQFKAFTTTFTPLLFQILGSLLLLTLAGCGDDYFSFQDNVYQNNILGETSEMQVDFEYISANILVPHCNQCHKRFADFDVVQGRIAGIQDSILQNRMPKDASPLSAQQKRMLNAWIKNGMPLTLAESDNGNL